VCCHSDWCVRNGRDRAHDRVKSSFSLDRSGKSWVEKMVGGGGIEESIGENRRNEETIRETGGSNNIAGKLVEIRPVEECSNKLK
jgi:hypothetical protein